jgi:hypothetical protein
MSATADRSHEPVPIPPPPGRSGGGPGWIEFIVGLASAAVLAVGLAVLIKPVVDQTTFNLFLMALSAIAAGGGFAVAVFVRVRRPTAFGVRRTSARWLLLGLGGGVLAFALKFPVTSLYVVLSGDAGNPQADWTTAATTGGLQLIVSLLFLGVLTPIGEELLFRGVVTTVLLRHGAIVGVVGSSVIFAILHGAPDTMFAAVIVGLIAGELRRRSDSIWPGVGVHIVFNLLSNVLAFVVAPALAA